MASLITILEFNMTSRLESNTTIATMKTFFILVVLGVLTINTLADDGDDSIQRVSRDTETISQLPQVTIHLNSKFYGVGVIIHSRFFLTTWSLLKSVSLDDIEVLAGVSTDKQLLSLRIEAVKYYYDRYEVRPKSTNEIRPIHNIALVMVRGEFDVKLNPYLRPPPMVDLGRKVENGTKVVLYGFNGGEQHVRQKLRIISSEECGKAYKNYNKTYNGEICAVETESFKKPCKDDHDEGSPLFVGRYLVGIASWLDYCNVPDSPVVFTNIGYHRDWIDEAMRIMLGGKLQKFLPEDAESKWNWVNFNDECPVGPKEQLISITDCQVQCKESGASHGECYGSLQCICTSWDDGDLPLYNRIHNISKLDNADATRVQQSYPGFPCFVRSKPKKSSFLDWLG